MIDTLEAYAFEGLEDLGKLSRYSTSQPYNYRGKIRQNFNVNGITFVAVIPDGVLERVSFKGSLHKYMLGNNVNKSNRLTASRALTRLITQTGLDLRHFRVTKIDFAVNLKLKHEVAAYIKKITRVAGGKFLRKAYSIHSIQFHTRGSHLKIRIYDKLKEARKKGQIKDVSEDRLRANILRFEFSIQYNLNHLKVSNKYIGLRVYEVTRDVTYMKLKSELRKRFNSLRFKPIPDYKGISNGRQFSSYLKLLGVEKLGGVDRAIEIVDHLRSTKKLNKNQRDSIVREIKKPSSLNVIRKKDSLVRELRDQFKREIKGIIVKKDFFASLA